MSPSCWFVFSDLIFKKPSTVYTVRSNQRAPSLGGCQGCPAKWYNGLWVSPFGACSDPLQVLFWAFTFLLYCLALLHLSSWQSDSPSPQVKASLSPLFPEVWTSVRHLYWRNNLIIRTRKNKSVENGSFTPVVAIKCGSCDDSYFERKVHVPC